MNKIIFSIFILISAQCSAQISNTFYGLARKSSPTAEIFLATVDPSTGVVTNISPNSLSPIVNLTGAALDPYNNNYHFIGYNEIKTINLTSGIETNVALLNNPIADSYFDNFRFNNSDSTLYGLARRYIYDTVTMTGYGEVFLATINTTTGTITQISPNSVGQGFALAGSAIDPYQMVFYYSTGSNLVGLDMYNGSIYSSVPIQLPVHNYFDNFTYSCSDTALYGLIRTNYYDSVVSPFDSTLIIEVLDSTAIRLGKIDPSNGVITVVSPYSIAEGGYSLNSGSTIDPSTMTYYYSNGSELVGVSLVTGLIVSQPTLTNTNGQYFDLMRIQSNCYGAKQPIRMNGVSSVNNVNDNLNISIKPNPASSIVHISSEKKIDKIEIINAIGSVVKSLKMNSLNETVDISQLSKGFYTLKIMSGNQISTTKLIKE